MKTASCDIRECPDLSGHWTKLTVTHLNVVSYVCTELCLSIVVAFTVRNQVFQTSVKLVMFWAFSDKVNG